MLTNRLQRIVDCIHVNERIADIGTDHAYIPIYLVEQGICDHALCSDIHEGPYEIAKSNVAQRGLSDKIEVRLGGGLFPYQPDEMDTVVIAGMGGEMVIKILQESPLIVESISRFLLQPMTALNEIRLYLFQNGYNIIDEFLAREGKKYYVVMDVIKEEVAIPSLEYLYIGKPLLSRPGEELQGYLQHWCNCWTVAIEGMERANHQQDELEKYRYLLEKVKIMQNNC